MSDETRTNGDKYPAPAFVALARALDPWETFTAGDGASSIRGRTRGDLAAAAIDALRALPVEERMEAMGMRSTLDHSFDRRCWIEAT